MIVYAHIRHQANNYSDEYASLPWGPPRVNVCVVKVVLIAAHLQEMTYRSTSLEFVDPEHVVNHGFSSATP
jgi:hypothetical protein